MGVANQTKVYAKQSVRSGCAEAAKIDTDREIYHGSTIRPRLHDHVDRQLIDGRWVCRPPIEERLTDGLAEDGSMVRVGGLTWNGG